MAAHTHLSTRTDQRETPRVNARTPAARALIAADIEAMATLEGRLIATATAYGPLDFLLGRRAARNSFCAQHCDD
ncbi:MAG: hypothetical protein H0W25_05315 [Acidimicrobiia bacterium]|nr:hypothetical protein [Acidimicrobiia bacterium]